MRLLALLLLLSLAQAQRLGVIGDWGADTPGRAQVAALLRHEHAQRPLTALLTVGDNFYPKGAVVETFLRELPPVPLYPAFGNHDAPRLWEQLRRFLLERPYYRLRVGGLEAFFLYSEDGLPAQRAWLEKALQASTAPLKVLLLHRPLYSSGLHGGSPTLRSLLEPLLRRHGVALVLAGHDHHYERLEVQGLLHVVTGGGGAGLYPTRPPVPWSRALAVAHHALFLEVRPEGLLGYALDPGGRLLDRFLIPTRP
ncbi:acid phosphatase [Thermus thermophilus]|uniref:metallophosphoesterase n=1 Tax=Thermus thermophilus TaxID=274 RepID=UPI001FCCAF50|nr:metallophosphoesterase [Thermus thermophilus]BDG25766.1 acid phosphatase [Thermus thermophilus]